MSDVCEVTYRPTHKRTLWFFVVLGAAGAALAGASLVSGLPPGWSAAGLLFVSIGLMALYSATSRVSADVHGVRSRTLLRRRSVAWHEVIDVGVRIQHRIRAQDSRHVVLTLRNGRGRTLPVPVSWVLADRDFDAAVEELRALHRRYGSPSSDHLHVVSHRTAGRSVLLPASLLAVFLAGAGLALWAVPGTASYAQAWRSADFCTTDTPAAELDECRDLLPAVIARTEAHRTRKKSWLYFAGGDPVVKRLEVSEGTARAFAPGDKVTLTFWRGEVMRVGNNDHVWRRHVPAAADAAVVAAGLLLAAGLPTALLLQRTRGRRLPDDDVLPSIIPFAVALVVTGCWLLPLCHRYPTAPPASPGGIAWAVTGSLLTLGLLAWAWRATRVRRPDEFRSPAAPAAETEEVFLAARFLDETDYNPFGNFGTHVVLGGGEPPAVLPHGGPGRFAARPIPLGRLTLAGIRRPRGGDGEAVPRTWHVAELDDAGTPVRLAAAPADLSRILRALGAAKPPVTTGAPKR